MTFGRTYRLAIAAGLGLLTVAAGGFALYTVRGVLVQVVFALFLAVSLDPAVRLLVRHGMRRSVAVGIIVLVALVILAGFVWSLVPPLVGQAGDLINNIPKYLQQLPERSRAYREIADRYGLTERLTDLATTLPAKVTGGAFGLVTGFFSAVVNVLLVTVLTIYFMSDLPRLRRGLVRLVPRASRPRAAQAINVVVDKVGGFMIGNLIVSLFAGVSTFICLMALRVPFALPLAVWVAVTDLIPMIGATVGAAGCLLVTLAGGDIVDTIVVLVFFVAYQQVENYLISPRVQRNTVDLSSVAVLLAALTGGAVLGIAGGLMAIPIAAAIKVLMTPVVEALNEPPEREPPADPPVPIPAPRDEDSSKLDT
ncbi:AI-2E family transporter [Dactylosporangium sp. CA-092794]|uniref:AI-2E family transporter n=1 Tax=Dactylosporangium sp. CA-092794 TaxID=3239929 RepID=UPI003D9182A1